MTYILTRFPHPTPLARCSRLTDARAMTDTYLSSVGQEVLFYEEDTEHDGADAMAVSATGAHREMIQYTVNRERT